MEHKEDIDDEWEQIEKLHKSPENYGWNMIAINENYIEVGDQASSTDDPPSPTHRDLSLPQIVPTCPEDGTLTSESDDGGVVAAPPSEWWLRVVNEWRKLLKLRLDGIGMREGVSNWAMRTWVFWSFTRVTGAGAVTAVLVSLVYMGIRRRHRSVDRWVYLLREKDEKISQLLFQIAQLNEVLSSRRKVSVHRVN
ncbi:hypothetical protein Fmac_005874 [Flemingia macrophylla]|uniref:Transmembrane protein n=1 Tax=Flemingia macrophylla TaxID=520843 RepID=A0ABD1N905_9FABA